MHIEPPGSLGVISLNHTRTWVKYIIQLTNVNKYSLLFVGTPGGTP